MLNVNYLRVSASVALFMLGYIVADYKNMRKTSKQDNKIKQQLVTVDYERYEQYQATKNINDSILGGVSDSTIKLYVTDTVKRETAGVDDGRRARRELHATDARRIIEITKRADECSARLSGLQRWVESQL